MPFDMLIKLYNLPENIKDMDKIKKEGISIKRPLALDKSRVVNFVREYFSQNWANECDVAFSKTPISCFVATCGEELVSFAAYDVTYKDFFGLPGVIEGYRGKGIGKVYFLKHCLL